jgi:hypothetical protein
MHQPTHFDSRTGSSSLPDPTLKTDYIQYVDSDTMHIDRSISDHDGKEVPKTMMRLSLRSVNYMY